MRPSQALPSHCLQIHKYDEFRQLMSAFASGAYDFVSVFGGPGLGKSEMIKRTMQQAVGANGWGLIKGKHTPLDLYERLYRLRSVPIVLDDLDDLLRKPDNVMMLKCVCESTPVKRVEWGSNHAAFRADLPKSFETISPVCLVSNDWNALDRNIGALHDRGVVMYFQPSAVEIHRELASAGWFAEEEVFDFIGRHLHLLIEPSFRFYKTVAAHKKAGLDWQGLALRSMESTTDPNLLLAAQLLADPKYDAMPSPEKSRVQAFHDIGGGSKATYYRCKAELLAKRGEMDLADVGSIKLSPPRPDLHYVGLLDRRDQIAQLRNAPDGEVVADVDCEIAGSDDTPDVDRIADLLEQLREAIADADEEEVSRLRGEIGRLVDE